MYYPIQDHLSTSKSHSRRAIRERVRREIVPEVSSDSWREYDNQLPLQHATDVRTLANLCLPFCTAEPKSDAVYILECRPNERYQHSAAVQFERTNKPWNGKVEAAERLLYVGMTIELIRRLDEHLNSPGDEGAHFTTIFPPIRILHVSWWSSAVEAMEAERITANQLRDRFPADFVYQS